MEDRNLTDEQKKELEKREKEQINGLIDSVLGASFGETGQTLAVSFKKTVLIRDYETEVIEASSTVTLDKPVSGAERTFITAMMRIQLEYEAYCNLLMKGMVTQLQFDTRKKALAYEFTSIKNKAEQITGKSMAEWMNINK